MSAKSVSEDPAQWAQNHTYHWFWGMVRVRRGDQKTIDTWWHEYSRDEAKQKKLHEEVVCYRNKNFISRFFIWLFNSENMSLKLKLYEFFMRHDPAMFANGERDSNMTNEDGMLNAVSRGTNRWFIQPFLGFFIKNDIVPKDSGQSLEEKHHDEDPSTPEVWPPHDEAMTQYLAVPRLHFTDTELQAAQEGLVIDTEEKLSALQEWENFYQRHIKRMAETGEPDEAEAQALEPSAAMGSEYYPKVISKQGRQMGLTFHPDKGGATEDSQRINELKEFLTQESPRDSKDSPWALRDAVCQFRTKVNAFAKQRFQNWQEAIERYIEASWSDSEESPDIPKQLKQIYYVKCEAIFLHYRIQREEAYRELMRQYAIQKSKYSESHPVAKGYAEVIARRAQLEREQRLADLELYREGCQTFFEPVVDDLKREKKEWLEERGDLRRKSENLKEEACDLEKRLKKLEQNRLKLDSEEVALREQSGDLDSKQCERRKSYLLSDQKSQALHQESYQRLLEIHKSNRSSYENSLARHQRQTESVPKQIFSRCKATYDYLKYLAFVGVYSPMSFVFWERELTECRQAIAYLVDLKEVYPGYDVPSHAAPKPPSPAYIMSSLALYHHLHNQAAHPTSASELEDKKGESDVALDGTDDELRSWMPPAGGDSAKIRQIQLKLSTYSAFPTRPTRITSLFTFAPFWGRPKKPEPFAEAGLASSLSKKADSLPVENPTVPKATLLTPGYDNATGRNNHQEQKFEEPPTHSNSNSNSNFASIF